jgi:isoquinoline 1-oxidoreductase
VHVGNSGKILAFTGKAEVGQGTRTALGLVVAEELRVPLDRVEVVMADTDVCPWDMGTFGSRSMPDAAPALGAAAAGARQTLVALAAQRTGKPEDQFVAADGEVRPREGGPGISYGELVRDKNRVLTVRSDVPLTPPAERRQVGRPAVDPAAAEVVTGRRTYVSDVRRPGMMYGAILRPPSYGARLTSLDENAVGNRPGVTVVHEADFVGVVAPSSREARAALGALRPRWEASPQPGEPEIEAYLRSHPLEGDVWDQDQAVEGDVTSALARAPVSIAATYRTAYIAHIPLETRCAIAEWDGPRLTVWVGTQTPFRSRDTVAEALGIPVENVRVIVPPTGSGFGGKHGGEIATEAARLARAAKAPVRVGFSREEEFRFGYLRPMSLVDVKVGGERDGRLTAWVFHNVNGGSAALRPPYHASNLKVDNELSDSPLPQGSYRALAANANNFARETAFDEFARAAGIDPFDVRERNLSDERLRAVLHRAAEKAGWSTRSRRPGKGHGLAVGLEKNSRVATIAEVTVGKDRRVHVDRLVTAFEAGAVVNPDNLRSQVEGATVMAMGGALFEEIRFDPGVIRNASLLTYRVPRFSDLPKLEVELVDRPDLPPSGAGETPMIAVAPAIGNAIFDATGRRLRTLPLVPDGKLPTQKRVGRPAPRARRRRPQKVYPRRA